MFVIVDTYDQKHDGNLRTHIIGIFDNLDEARDAIEKIDFKNFRWVGRTRFKFSTDEHAHVGDIISIRKNEIFQDQIEGDL